MYPESPIRVFPVSRIADSGFPRIPNRRFGFSTYPESPIRVFHVSRIADSGFFGTAFQSTGFFGTAFRSTLDSEQRSEVR